MTMRRFNAWLHCFAKSREYSALLYMGWLIVAAAAVLFVPLRLLLIAEGLS